MKIFCDIDTQFDFMDPLGTLYVRHSDRILGNVQKLVKHASGGAGLLVGSLDTHDFRCPEFLENGGEFPRHCVKGTLGWTKMPDTLPDRAVIIPASAEDANLVPGATGYYFEKQSYSIFETRICDLLFEARREAGDVQTHAVDVYVFGVAADYCVSAAALGFRDRGYTVHLVQDAAAAVAEDPSDILHGLHLAGIHLVHTSDVLATI